MPERKAIPKELLNLNEREEKKSILAKEEGFFQYYVDQVRRERRSLLKCVLGNGLLIGTLAMGFYGIHKLAETEQEALESRKPEIARLEEIVGSSKCQKETAASVPQMEYYYNFAYMLHQTYPELWYSNQACGRKHGFCDFGGTVEYLRETTLFCPYLNNSQFESKFHNDSLFREQVASYVKMQVEDIYLEDNYKTFFRLLLAGAALGISIRSLFKLSPLWSDLKGSLRRKKDHLKKLNTQRELLAQVHQIVDNFTEQESSGAQLSELNGQFRELLAEMIEVHRKRKAVFDSMKQLLVKGQPGNGVYREDPVADLSKERLQRMRIALDNDDLEQAKEQFEALLEEALPEGEEQEAEAEPVVSKSEKINQ